MAKGAAAALLRKDVPRFRMRDLDHGGRVVLRCRIE